jgi:hypothetical protein
MSEAIVPKKAALVAQAYRSAALNWLLSNCRCCSIMEILMPLRWINPGASFFMAC